MSRTDGRSSPLRRRPSRAVPAMIVGVLLLAAAVALFWLSSARIRDGTWSSVLQGFRDWLTALTWNSSGVWAVGAAAIVAGLIMVLCAIVPGRFNALTMRNAGSADAAGNDRETVMTCRAVAHLARAHCARLDGVSSASATATDKRVHLRVRTPLRDPGDLRNRVIEEVRDRLKSTGLDPLPHVSATVESKD